MGYATNMKQFAILALLVISFLVLLSAIDPSEPALDQGEGRVNAGSQPEPLVFPATTTLPIRVSGVVTASERAVISARVAGPIERFLVAEGDAVVAGEVLVQQSDPVSEAELALREAERSLIMTQQSAAVAAAQAATERSDVIVGTAEEIASIEAVRADARVQEAVTNTLNADEAALTTLLAALQFVNTNRLLFDSAALDEYERTVNDLYGTMPGHFSSGARRRVTDHEDIRHLIGELRREESPSVTTVSNLHTLLDIELRTLVSVFEGAEADVFDRDRTETTDLSYQGYFDQRSALISARANSLVVEARLRDAIDAARANEVDQAQAVSLSAIEYAAATEQAAFAAAIAEAAVKGADASRSVSLAHQSLTSVAAPFSGVVVERYREAGEYATPGTPLLSVSGTEGRELTVNLQSPFAAALRVGQTLERDGQIIGVVERFGVIDEGGGVPVIIAITDPEVRIGETVVGEVKLTNVSDVIGVPRSHLGFAGGGPIVQRADGEMVTVSIIYDAGEIVYVEADALQDSSVVPIRTVTLD